MKSSIFAAQVVQDSKTRSKFALTLCRVISLIIGTLMFLMVAPEFQGMPGGWVVFWTALPFAPVLCVCIGAGRNRFVEAAGWLLHVLGIMLFL